MRSETALLILVAVVVAACPLRTCFASTEDKASTSAPGEHGHESHEGPDGGSQCCTDVPTEASSTWIMPHLDTPTVTWAQPASMARLPSRAPETKAPQHIVPVRTTVRLR